VRFGVDVFAMEKKILLIFENAKGLNVSRKSRLLIEMLVTFMFSHSEHFQTASQLRSSEVCRIGCHLCFGSLHETIHCTCHTVPLYSSR
jgi:hypothetical protein